MPAPRTFLPLTAARLREVLHYDPETGLFTWIAKTHKKANNKIGDVAGTSHDKGYILIRIDKVGYYGHRLAWLYMTGEWPPDRVDHRDGGPPNTWWANLRLATNPENSENLKCYANNTTGHPGVRWRPEMQKYQARITKGGVDYHLGSFRTFEEAVAARVTAKASVHPFQPEERKIP